MECRRPSADGHGGEMEEMGVFFINFAVNPATKKIAATEVDSIGEKDVKLVLKQVNDMSSMMFQ
jgi:hypothetical protein